jgi:hypothetical protein
MAVGLQHALIAGLLALSAPVWAAKKVDLDYHVRLLPQSDQVEVRLTLAKGEAVRSLDFDLGDGSYYSDFKADGQWLFDAGQTGTRRVAPDERQGQPDLPRAHQPRAQERQLRHAHDPELGADAR